MEIKKDEGAKCWSAKGFKGIKKGRREKEGKREDGR